MKMKYARGLLSVLCIAALTGCASLAAPKTMPGQIITSMEQAPYLSPTGTLEQLVKAINQGDLDTALACYEDRAIFVVEPGKMATGKKALREALAGFIAMKIVIVPETYKFIETDGLALYTSKWSATGSAADGSALKISGNSSDVLRRQVDGRWLIAIDNPYGAAILP